MPLPKCASRTTSPFAEVPWRSASVTDSTNLQAAKQKQSQRYEPDEDGPERSEEDPPDRTLAIARPTALAQSGEQRQPADDAIDDASRTEPHAGETLDRIAAHSLHEETFTMTCGGDERTDRVPSNAVRARTAPA